MSTPTSSQAGDGQNRDVLTGVKEGMDVYDVNDNHMGTVDAVYFGGDVEDTTRTGSGDVGTTDAGMGDVDAADTAIVANAPNAGAGASSTGGAGAAGGALVGEFANAFADDDVPQPVRNRLMNHGFIRIAGGLFGSDRYIMPDQIASVSGDRVTLSRSKDDIFES